MGLFDFLKKEKPANEAIVDNTPAQRYMTIESNTRKMQNPSLKDVFDYITDMLSDDSRFVTLLPMDSIENIRYIQACRIEKGIDFEIALVKNGKTYMMQKTVDEVVVYSLFEDYYNGKPYFDISEFSPLQ